MVMPSFNQRRYIVEAVSSVLDQAGVRVELLVLDPGSTDGSREALENLQNKYGPSLRLVFEPDSGQSDAVNKGMALAKAPVLGWLNSDDRLCAGALQQVVRSLNPSVPTWIYGQANVIDGEGRPTSSFITTYKNIRSKRFSMFKLLQENFISQMAVFWTRPLWEKAGMLATDKHLDMDYDLWLRFAKVVQPSVLHVPLASFRVHAAAKGSVQSAAQLVAAFETAREHSQNMGLRGQVALGIHRVLSARTKLIYKLSKP